MTQSMNKPEWALIVYRTIEDFVTETGISPSVAGTIMRSGLPQHQAREGLNALVNDGLLRVGGKTVLLNDYLGPQGHQRLWRRGV